MKTYCVIIDEYVTTHFEVETESKGAAFAAIHFGKGTITKIVKEEDSLDPIVYDVDDKHDVPEIICHTCGGNRVASRISIDNK